MPTMPKKTILLAIILFAVVIIGMFVFAYLKRTEISQPPVDTQDEVAQPTPYDYITRVDAKHFFIDGVHTVAGEIQMPTPCDLLESSSRVAESMPEQVTISFNVINNAERCTQVVTPQRFMTSFSASEGASIKADFMGRPIELNLIPAAEGETPEDFEIYIKG